MKLLKSLKLVLGLAFSVWLSHAATMQAQEIPPSKTRLILSPAKPPLPAMKYELLPKAIDRVPGNAAVHYGKVNSEQNNFFSSRTISTILKLATERPLNELESNSEFDILTKIDAIYAHLKRASLCIDADWQLPTREEFFGNILLPEVQETKSFGRILQGRARVQIARGDLDGAMESIQTGLALAQHVARGETLVNGLVGMVITEEMLDCVQELITQPESPNLYWALATLPSPFIDLRPGLEAEQFLLYWTERKWLHPELMAGDEDFWRSELERLWGYVNSLLDEPKGKAFLALKVMSGYRSAKQRLIDRGLHHDTVESMPVAKVIMIDTLHQYNCNRDAQYAAVQQALLDPSRALPQVEVDLQKYEECLPISKAMGVRNFSAVVLASTKLRTKVAVLQTIEAIRAHAASTGKLPPRLSEVTAMKVPNDPSSHQPFNYELMKDTAILSSPNPKAAIRLELQLR